MIVVIYSSFPTKELALEVGKELLENNLIVCTNVVPITSQYIWKGKFHEEQEFGAYYKTSLEKQGQAVKHLKKRHPYQVPIITTEKLVVNNAYKNWMDSMLT